MKKEISLKDIDNKRKSIRIGEPFLRDGTFWITICIGEENLPSVRISMKDVDKLLKFLEDYRAGIIKEQTQKSQKEKGK